MHNDHRIQSCCSFRNKRSDLVIELPDRELHPYVLDGYARCAVEGHPASPQRRQIATVQFNGWGTTFVPAVAEPADTPHYKWVLYGDVGIWQCQFEVVFRMIDNPEGRQTQRRPDVLAISFDGCQSFVNNARCLLTREYEHHKVAV